MWPASNDPFPLNHSRSLFYHSTSEIRKAIQVEMFIAEQSLERNERLEVSADLIFLGQPNSAMQLNGIFPDEPGRASDRLLCSTHGACPLPRRIQIERIDRNPQDRAGLIQPDEHFSEPVLKSLESGQLLPELLAH